jgi:tRNA A37 threonylcarbamoyladenosine dehydratase
LSLGNFDEGIGKIFYTISQNINQEYDYDDRVIFSSSLSDKYDYVIDAIDMLSAKLDLIERCTKKYLL